MQFNPDILLKSVNAPPPKKKNPQSETQNDENLRKFGQSI